MSRWSPRAHAGPVSTPVADSAPPALTGVELRWCVALHERLDLANLRSPLAPLGERVEALHSIMEWLRTGGERLQLRAAPSWQLTRRLRLLLHLMETDVLRGGCFVRLVRSVVAEVGGTALFETGLANDRGFLAETSDRLARRFLPTPHDAGDLGELLFGLLASPQEIDWLLELPLDLLARFVALVSTTDAAAAPQPAAAAHAVNASRFVHMARDTFALVAMRAAALGLTREIRVRSEPTALQGSPFFLLARDCDALLSSLPWSAAVSGEVRSRIAECRATLPVVLRHLEEFGVSVDVVYRVEVITQCLDRLGALLELITAPDGTTQLESARSLVASLARARLQDRSLRDVARSNLRLLARKIIERAGATGEHYITTTRREYGQMLLSAGGGGLLTSVTAVFKFLVLWAHLPLFLEGALASGNYALSFLCLQLLGLTLATKQPSMTAAALAGALSASSGEQKLDDMVTLIARIVRSQLAAALGNIVCVTPAAIGLDALFRLATGRHIVDAHSAEHTLQSLDPLGSGTIPFAVLTGVLLWMSSVCAGWLENWAVYRRLPDAIADSPLLIRLLGRARTARLGRWLPRNLSGIGGNVSLGILLGMTPVIGRFFGLPVEVRHVTLSTGALALSMCGALSEGLSALAARPFLAAVAGIGVMGVLNFGVSFTLALAVALRAREVDRSWRIRLVGALLTRFRKSPLEFVFPPAA